MWPLLLLLCLFLLPLLCLLFLGGRRRWEEGRRSSSTAGDGDGAAPPPGPRNQVPVLGNLLRLGGRPHRYFRELAARHGPVVQVQLGSVRAVVVSSAEAARDVLRTNDLCCCSRPDSPGPRMLTYNFLDVAFCPYTDYWREMRKLFVMELLSKKRVQSFAYARAAEIDRLIASIASSPPGAPVNMNEKLYALADGVIGTVAFGKMYGSSLFDKGKFQEVMDETLQVLGSFTYEDFFPSSAAARWADALTGAAARRRRIFRKIDGFFDAIIDKHLEPERMEDGGEQEEDLVDALVKLWKEQGEAVGLTRDHVKGVLLNTFAGGIDTCAVTTIWTMSELMRNERVMCKARTEVRNMVKLKERVDEEDIPKLNYLKMIVKENFRLHPPVTLLLPRETLHSCKIGGYNVPEKTRIFINVWAMGRDHKLWDNPDEFYPERFEITDIDFSGSHFELLPFGSGRRVCPGLAMGVANVELALANLLYFYDWGLPKGMKNEDINMEEVGSLTFRKKAPLYIVPKMCG